MDPASNAPMKRRSRRRSKGGMHARNSTAQIESTLICTRLMSNTAGVHMERGVTIVSRVGIQNLYSSAGSSTSIEL
jgi:hypothetical protein